MLSNLSMGVKIGAKSARMGSGGSKMEVQWPTMEARTGHMPPQEPQRSTRAAWSAPSRCQEASQRAQDRLVHVFASDFGSPKATKGSRNRTAKRTKSEAKKSFVSDHVSGPIFIDLEV